MEFWDILIYLVSLLGVALLFGAILERLGQSAILGYLAAGMLLGPGALNLVASSEVVTGLAELGVSLLLFTIGLEFSWPRLRSLGAVAFGGGSLQVVVTGLVTGAVCLLLGQSIAQAIAFGAMVALSSTTCVLRSLIDRAELDSVHGRHALGILLLQDIAVAPLVLLVTALASQGSSGQMLMGMGRAIGLAVLLIAVLHVISRYLLPRVFAATFFARNRELPILLAVVICVGATWGAHKLNLSPAFGAFVAGMLLGESPFATQIRADVHVLRTLFVTLFFVSIGMLAELAWIAGNLFSVVLVVVAVVLGKALIIWAIIRIFHNSHRTTMATGLCLAQVGEFSFVLAEIAYGGRLIGDHAFKLFVAATVVAMFLTPFLVGVAPIAGRAWERLLTRIGLAREPEPAARAPQAALTDHVIVVGYGPAGREAAGRLQAAGFAVAIVDLNPRSVAAAQEEKLTTVLGDAARQQVLDHAYVSSARAVVVTIPDHRTARQIIMQVKAVAPSVPVVSRARYHLYAPQLAESGAHVVDEEHRVGRLLGRETLTLLRRLRTLPPVQGDSTRG